MFATMGHCLKILTVVIYCHYVIVIVVVLFYNTECQQYHGMGVNYHGKKVTNIGPRGKCFKTFSYDNLPPCHGHTVILCYKATLPR